VGDEGMLISGPLSFGNRAHVWTGANYSAGEKQLLALCRALVKNSRIIILVCVPRDWRV
jgi:ATP-binding cassette subfamily C (CFTR/MRP) protein 1